MFSFEKNFVENVSQTQHPVMFFQEWRLKLEPALEPAILSCKPLGNAKAFQELERPNRTIEPQ